MIFSSQPGLQHACDFVDVQNGLRQCIRQNYEHGSWAYCLFWSPFRPPLHRNTLILHPWNTPSFSHLVYPLNLGLRLLIGRSDVKLIPTSPASTTVLSLGACIYDHAKLRTGYHMDWASQYRVTSWPSFRPRHWPSCSLIRCSEVSLFLRS